MRVWKRERERGDGTKKEIRFHVAIQVVRHVTFEWFFVIFHSSLVVHLVIASQLVWVDDLRSGSH
jgi:hypothetical protein